MTKRKIHLGLKLGKAKYAKACVYNRDFSKVLDGINITGDVHKVTCVKCQDLIEMAYDL